MSFKLELQETVCAFLSSLIQCLIATNQNKQFFKSIKSACNKNKFLLFILPLIQMGKCARPVCLTASKSFCSICTREHYCSGDCQKLDWKTHKSICSILKKLSKKLQPYCEVSGIIGEIIASKKGSDVRVLDHLFLYAEYQFGKETLGVCYRERENGERIRNWDVEIRILLAINRTLLNGILDSSLSDIIYHNRTFPYLQRSLKILNPWLIRIDTNANNRLYSLDEDQKNKIFHELVMTESQLAAIKVERRHFGATEGHCQRCLAYSKRLTPEGETKIALMFMALQTYCELREYQSNYSDALKIAEEIYNLVVVAYDCVHPKVQKAAGILINILIKKDDLVNAERYALVTLGNLRDKKNGMDQDGAEVANGFYNIANVIYRQNLFISEKKMEELVKGEGFARESIRIWTLIDGKDSHNAGTSCMLLARILLIQNKLEDETLELFERFLAISINHEGRDGINGGTANINLGQVYCARAYIQPTIDLRKKQLLLAKPLFEEGVRINSKIFGPSHPSTVDGASRLAAVIRDLSFNP